MPMIGFTFTTGCELTLAQDSATVSTPRGPLRITDLADGQVSVLRALASAAPVSVDGLVDVATTDSRTPAAWVHMTLDRLVGLGFVSRVVGNPAVARITVTAPGYRPRVEIPDGESILRLDRLAYQRPGDGFMILESAQALSRMEFEHPGVGALLAALVTPVPIDDAVLASGLPPEIARSLVDVLHSDGFLIPGQDSSPGEDPSWPEWSFHDAVFHNRSRSGRHGYAYGATYHHEGSRPALPAVKERPTGTVIELATVDLDAARLYDPPFAEVLESRQSWRVPGPRPVHVDEIGEFLWRSARVRGRRDTEHEEISARPYAGGGADYELEIYLVAHRIDNLQRGLYHYDPLDHLLVHIKEWTPTVEAIAQDVASKTNVEFLPDAMLLVTARMQRLTYKYESIPYSVALKDMGTLYGTWYLTATAMGLAPCAIGGGDGELLAEVTGIPSWTEARIGEFILNTPHPDERRGSLPPPRVSRNRVVNEEIT
jgi:SagB-type dehydrogenase family enzyme